MDEEIRKSGLAIIGGIPWGTHFCQFYQTKADLLDILVPYFQAGLENNEFCMWVTADNLTAAAARKAMTKAVKDFSGYLKKGQIEILPYTEWYLQDGVFESSRVLAGWVEKLQQAQQKGYAGLRLTGNTFWLEKKDWQSFTDYEETINNVIGNYKMIALCTYSLEKCSATEIVDVIRNHEFTLIKKDNNWDVFESARYKNNKEALIESEKRFRLALKNAPVTVAAQDRDLKFLWAYNQRTQKPEDVLGKTDFDIFPKKDAEKLVALKRWVLATGNKLNTKKWITSGGKKLYLDLFVEPVKDGTGNITGVEIATVNLTGQKLAEAALKESENKYRLLFENMSEGLALCEMLFDDNGQPADYRFLNINPVFEKFIGLTNKQISGKTALEVLPNVQPKAIETFGQVVNTRKPVHFENYSRDLTKWFDVFAYHAGRNRFAYMVIDITARKHAETALKESEERFRMLSEASPVVISVTRISDRIVLYVNKAYSESLGYRADRVIGMKATDIYFNQKDREAMISKLNREGFLNNYEMRVKRGDGTPFWASTSVRFTEFNGERAIIAASLDITELKTAAAEKQKLADSVQAEKDRLAVLVNSIPDEIWFADTNRHFTLANPAALGEFGYAAADAIDIETMANNLEVLRPDGTLRPVEETPPLRALAGITIRNQEEIVRTPATGELRYRQVNAAPVKDVKGNIIGSVSVVRDITEQKKLEQQQQYLASFPAMNPMQIVELDQTGRVNYCNESTLKLFPDLLALGKNHPYLAGLAETAPDLLAQVKFFSREMEINGRYYEQVIYTFGDNRQIRIYGQDITTRRKAEDALKAARKTLEEAQRIARLGSWEWNVRTDELHWSQELYEIYGVDPALFKPTMELFADLIHPADRDRLNTVMGKLVSGGQPVDIDFRIILRDQSIRYLHTTSAISSLDENGKGLVYIGTTQDITERMRLDNVLRQDEERFRILSEINSLLLTSQQPEKIIRVIADKVMRYLDCDAFFNFIIDETKGKLKLNAWAGIPAETAKTIEWLDIGTAICGCVARDNSPITSFDVQHNSDERAALVRSFGIQAYASYPLQAGSSVIGTVSFGTKNRTSFTDGDLDFIGIVAAQVSVAIHRKQIEEKLENSEERFHKAFHASPVGLSISNIEDGTFLDVNESFLQMFGYQRDELIGKPAAGLNLYDNPLDRAEIVHQLQQAGKVINLEITARTKSGNEINVLTSAESIEINNRKNIIWTSIDITARKIAEDRLKESEERFSKAFHSSPLGMVITTLPEGRFIDANESFLRITHYTRKDIIGRTSAEFNLFANPPDREQLWQMLLAQGSFNNVEMTWRTKTGKIINVISSNEKFILQGREHAVFMMFDNTERKKAEKEVILLNRELRAITECDQIMVHSNDEQKLFSEICHTMCSTAGYRLVWIGVVEEDENKTVLPVAWFGNEEYIKNVNITWAADNPRGQGPSGLAARTGKTHFFQDFATAPAAAPWREAALALGYRSSIALPLFDRTGAVFGVFTLYSAEPDYFKAAEIRLLEELAGDISFAINAMQEKTEREKAEDLLRETTNYLNNLFDYANAPIIVWDPQFHITRFNHAFERLTGIKAAEAIGKPLDILFPEDSKVESLDYIKRTTAGERWEVVEINIQSNNGETHTVLWNSATLFDEDGKNMIATIAQGQDITQRKKAEEQVKKLNEELMHRAAELEASNKELEAFSYSVSHDLRAPLRSITGFSTILHEDYREKLDDEGKLYLKKISDSGELMGRLIDDLLQLSRVTRSDIYYEKVNLSDIAQNVVEELARTEPKRQVKVDLAPDMIAYGDRTLLRLVLQNLLGNAWKYTGKTAAPEIEMGSLIQEGKQVYFIRDNGVGFDMTYSHKLFQPFQRLHKATEFTGTGIGLATVQRIVRRHGGKVWADSKSGEGATFYFTLA